MSFFLSSLKMMEFIVKTFIALCALGLLSFSGFAKERSSPSLPVWRVISPVVNGTGFFAIRSNWVLTDFDVIKLILEEHDLQDVYLAQGAYRLRVKKLLKVSGLHGLALLEVDHHVENPLRFRESPFLSKENLSVIGYSYDGTLQSLKKIGGISYSDPLVYQFPFNSWGMKGVNGGPILDDEDQVVGVVKDIDMNVLTGINIASVMDFIEGQRLECSEFANAKECVKQEMKRFHNIASNTEEIHIKYQYLFVIVQDPESSIIENFLLNQALMLLAERGYLLAQYKLGEGYLGQDDSEAWYWFNQSSQLIQSQFYKGMMEEAEKLMVEMMGLAPLFKKEEDIPNSMLNSAVHGFLPAHLAVIRSYDSMNDRDGVRFWCSVLKKREINPPVYNQTEKRTSTLIRDDWNDIVPVCRSEGYEIGEIVPGDTPPDLSSSEEILL